LRLSKGWDIARNLKKIASVILVFEALLKE